MSINSVWKKVTISALCFSLLSIAMLPSMTYAGRSRAAPAQAPVINPVTFETNREVKVYRSNVSGSSYGWKIILFIKISSPDYNDAVNDLWENAGVSEADRGKYQLVNIRQTVGTSWGIILCGQNYLTVTADVAVSI